MILGAVKFPPIENVIEWPAWLFEDSTYFAFNKIAFIHFLGMAIPAVVFLLAARGDGLVPRGFRTVAESIVGFCVNADKPADAIQKAMRDLAPEHMIPERIEFLTDLHHDARIDAEIHRHQCENQNAQATAGYPPPGP